MEKEPTSDNNKNKAKRIFTILLIILLVLLITAIGFTAYLLTKNKQDNITSSNHSNDSQVQEDTNDIGNNSKIEGKKNSSIDDPNGPFYQKIYSATSDDGILWTILNEEIFDHASVPTALLRDDIMYLYFVDASGDYDQLSVGISYDLGETFEKHNVDLEDFDESYAVDPSVELVSSNIIRLYFYGGFHIEDEDNEPMHTIYYTESEDGINFGKSYAVYTDEGLTDPDIIQEEDEWWMIVNKENDEFQFVTSSDNGRSFGTASDILETSTGGCCDTILINNEYYSYCMETSKKISLYKGIENGRLDNTYEKIIKWEGNEDIGHPAVIQLPDKTYQMYYIVLNSPDGIDN